jgi:RNA polymerase sigma-70 factor, ECF subfamily
MQFSRNLELSHPGITSSWVEQDDGQLVKACQRGDSDAFALLVHRHQRLIFNMNLRILQDYEDACEVTQEAFFEAWQQLPSFRGETHFLTWLYRIAYSCCLRQIKRRKRKRGLLAVMKFSLSRTS